MLSADKLGPNDLLRLAELLKLNGETLRLFSCTKVGGNVELSRGTELAINVEAIATEVAGSARNLGAVPDPAL